MGFFISVEGGNLMESNLVYIERVLRRLKQSEVESLSGIPQPRLSKIERGVAKPKQEEKESLARAFGLEAGELFPG